MKRVACFGELMLRLSPPGHERLFQTPTLRTWFGGSEANVAVGLAHLGLRSEFLTRLPANALGEAASHAIRGEGVDLRRSAYGGKRLGIFFVESGADIRPLRVIYDRTGSAFSEITPDDIDWDAVMRSTDWFHTSGITPALGDGAARSVHAAVEEARRAGVPVSLDLNYRPALWTERDPRPVIRPIAERCDVLIGNPGAIAAMLGIEGEASPQALCERVAREVGCRHVALTQREVLSASEHGWSAALFDARAGTFLTSRRWQVRLVDRVGGGDSFAAGLIYAALTGREPAAALEFATAASALKLTIHGDFNLVSADEVDRLLTSVQ
jgi:2-dehydro-3-deoxygluconokinase